MLVYHCQSCRLDMQVLVETDETYVKTVGCHTGNSKECQMAQSARAEHRQATRFLRPSNAEVPSHA